MQPCSILFKLTFSYIHVFTTLQLTSILLNKPSFYSQLLYQHLATRLHLPYTDSLFFYSQISFFFLLFKTPSCYCPDICLDQIWKGDRHVQCSNYLPVCLMTVIALSVAGALHISAPLYGPCTMRHACSIMHAPPPCPKVQWPCYLHHLQIPTTGQALQ